uniref:Ycf15 n=1 Tax=Evolvulus alsinoides TaxID=439689 RepID=UPI001D0FC2E4|nr:Ycf15 [Evolvulus alsinoides]YP_010192050.1 Ycf15 [Evolvulus alsinoides]QZN05678.1 Ycf15 [Evolvulus alsinoides]QZN05692.1 Ycf15 [Evolvulus alsinoides]
MNCWHQSYILSLWTEEKGGSAGREVYQERSKEVNLLQIYNMDSGNVVGLSCRSE